MAYGRVTKTPDPDWIAPVEMITAGKKKVRCVIVPKEKEKKFKEKNPKAKKGTSKSYTEVPKEEKPVKEVI